MVCQNCVWYQFLRQFDESRRLYDFHPNGKEDLLIDTMKQLKYTGVPWEKVFSQQVSS